MFLGFLNKYRILVLMGILCVCHVFSSSSRQCLKNEIVHGLYNFVPRKYKSELNPMKQKDFKVPRQSWLMYLITQGASRGLQKEFPTYCISEDIDIFFHPFDEANENDA